MSSTFDIGGQAGNAFPFDTIGASVTGKVLSLDEIQQTDMDTNEPAFWPDGKPKMQYRVTLQTELRDPNNAADDGKRSIYLRGSRKSESKSSLAAVLDAVKAATGTTELAVGGTLTLTYVSDGQRRGAGFNPPKQYAASYTPPAVNLDPAPASQQPTPQQQPAAIPYTSEQLAALRAAGLDPDTLQPA